MSSPLWRFVLFAAGMSGLVSGQNVPLNQADGWSPMGDSPVVVRWDNEAEAISFAAERGETLKCASRGTFAREGNARRK